MGVSTERQTASCDDEKEDGLVYHQKMSQKKEDHDDDKKVMDIVSERSSAQVLHGICFAAAILLIGDSQSTNIIYNISRKKIVIFRSQHHAFWFINNQ